MNKLTREDITKVKIFVLVVILIPILYYGYQSWITPTAAYRDTFAYSDYYNTKNIIASESLTLDKNISIPTHWGKIFAKENYIFSPILISILHIISEIDIFRLMSYFPITTILLSIAGYLVSREIFERKYALISTLLFVWYPLYVPPFKIDPIHITFSIFTLCLFVMLTNKFDMKKKIIILAPLILLLFKDHFIYPVFFGIMIPITLIIYAFKKYKHSNKLKISIPLILLITTIIFIPILIQSLNQANQAGAIPQLIRNLENIPQYIDTEFISSKEIQKTSMTFYGVLFILPTLPLFIYGLFILIKDVYTRKKFGKNDIILSWIISSILLGMPMILGFSWSGHKIFFYLTITYIILFLTAIKQLKYRKIQVGIIILILILSLGVSQFKNTMLPAKQLSFTNAEVSTIEIIPTITASNTKMISDIRLGGLLVSHINYHNIITPTNYQEMMSLFYSCDKIVLNSHLSKSFNNEKEGFFVISKRYFTDGLVIRNQARVPLDSCMLQIYNEDEKLDKIIDSSDIIIYKYEG